MFIQKSNPVTGKMEWLKSEDDEDLRNEIARSTYAGMLHDHERNIKYHAALKKTIKKMKVEGKASKVLDIGTGTGILSMMAVSSGADSVTACEVFEPMAKIAKEVIKRNGMENKITVIDKRSTEIKIGTGMDMTDRANILVTEIFDTELIGEGVLPTLRHARKTLLQEGCKVIPSIGNVYIQLAESHSLWKRQKIDGPKFSAQSQLKTMNSLKYCKGTASADELHVDEVEDLRILSSPTEVVRFDFSKNVENLENNTRTKSYTKEIKVTSSGTIHCVVLWWEIYLDEEKEINLSMVPKCSSQNPEEVRWRDHWMQAVYYLPHDLNVREGDVMKVSTFHDDYCFWFDVQPTNREVSETECKRPVCSCGLHTVWSRERFTMCNDDEYWQRFNSVLRKNKSVKHALVLGDVSILPLYVAQAVEKVTYIEFSQMSKDIVQKLACLNKVGDKIAFMKLADTTLDDLHQLLPSDQIDAVIAEPFFSSSLLPWQHFTFWYYFSDVLKKSGKLQLCMPRKAILKLVAVQFEDLWKVRKPVKEIGEFNLDAFDEVIEEALLPEASDDHGLLYEVEPYAMWEYRHKILSEIIHIGEFNFMKEISEFHQIMEGNIRFTSSGTCHGFVIWVDFLLDDEKSWSTGYQTTSNSWVKHSKQGVHFVKDPQSVSKEMSTDYRITFEPSSCKILFQFGEKV